MAAALHFSASECGARLGWLAPFACLSPVLGQGGGTHPLRRPADMVLGPQVGWTRTLALTSFNPDHFFFLDTVKGSPAMHGVPLFSTK